MYELKEIYINVLKEHSKPIVKNKDNSKVNFDFELNKILENAEKEMEATGSKKVGTEHVLLSILNPSNEIKIKDVFKTVGIEYSFILDKCSEDKIKPKHTPKAIKPKGFISNKIGNSLKPAIFPLKSEVNASSVVTKDEYVSKFTTNLNELAKNGKIDELVGRKDEINEIIKVLARRKKNNVILVGNGGVGKTEIVYGLASMISKGNVPSILEGKEIVMIDIMAIVSGTHFRGMFEERIKGLFDELKSSSKYILFIDDMQNVLKSGSKDKDTDISGMIGDILSGGDVRVIGTTTFKDYRNSIESNTSISRKMQRIVIEAPNTKEAIETLKQSKGYYEEFHNVKYTDEAIEKAVELAERYITDRSLPDSAFDVIDLAGASTSIGEKEPKEIIAMKKRLDGIEEEKSKYLNAGEFEKIDAITLEENVIKKELSDYKREQSSKKSKEVIIDADDINETISEMVKVPVSKLSSNEKKKIAHIDEILKNSVVGQDEAVDAICKVIKRNKVGLGDKTKTMANILMAGPTGCGKCVSKNTKIRIRNKKTLEIQELTIEEFKKLVSRTNQSKNY